MSGTFTPAAARAPMLRILARYTGLELRLALRRGQAIGFTLAIPALAIVGIGLTDVVRLPTGDRLGFVVPGATLTYVVLLVFSGVMFPLPDLGRAELLNPLAAYAETLRRALSHGAAAEAWAWYCLGLWAVGSVYAAALWFRWE